MNPLYIIPARGGSKGIPHKNIKELNGKPLICGQLPGYIYGVTYQWQAIDMLPHRSCQEYDH